MYPELSAHYVVADHDALQQDSQNLAGLLRIQTWLSLAVERQFGLVLRRVMEKV